jgi:hypothetical protein
MKKLLILCGIALFCSYGAKAQSQNQSQAQDTSDNDLLSGLEQANAAQVKDQRNYTIATFKSTRVVNMPDVEMTAKGNLNFMITHHFGPFWNDANGQNLWSNLGALFGVNGGVANTYLSFDYSPSTWLNIGVAGTGTAQLEGWLKFRILRQQTGLHNIPISLVWMSTAHVDASAGPSPNDFAWNRFSFLHQLMIARKFNETLSLQLMGSMVHYNLGYYGYNNTNNVFSVGLQGQVRMTRRSAITFEYSRQVNMYKDVTEVAGTPTVNYNPDLISLGYNFDTGGHIFQFFISNTSVASNLTQLSRNTSDRWKGFALGFNLNRDFGVKKKVSVPN